METSEILKELKDIQKGCIRKSIEISCSLEDSLNEECLSENMEETKRRVIEVVEHAGVCSEISKTLKSLSADVVHYHLMDAIEVYHSEIGTLSPNRLVNGPLETTEALLPRNLYNEIRRHRCRTDLLAEDSANLAVIDEMMNENRDALVINPGGQYNVDLNVHRFLGNLKELGII